MSQPNPFKVVSQGRFPEWLHRKLPEGENLSCTKESIKKNRLHTVCEEAKCPNLQECYSKKTATFLIMGKACTRACPFCDIDFSKKPVALDPEEPKNVAFAVGELGLKHVVITMVARDDLPDGGAQHLTQVIDAIRFDHPAVTIETLTSDFDGNKESLLRVMEAKPAIFNHNVETVERLTPTVRHRATYRRSLETLAFVKKQFPNQLVKSGLMLGLGETKEEVIQTLKDLKAAGCDIVTMGQYLKPSRLKLEVKDFIHPTQFEEYADIGRNLGIRYMYTGPFVRSSYNAGLVFNNTTINSD